MRIPNAHRGVIESGKLLGYLLSRTHPIGRFKAAFFITMGYSSANWRQLESDLRNLLLSEDAALEQRTAFGQKYAIRATLVGPSGRTADVTSIWIVRNGEDFPRFITAYPEDWT